MSRLEIPSGFWPFQAFPRSPALLYRSLAPFRLSLSSSLFFSLYFSISLSSSFFFSFSRDMRVRVSHACAPTACVSLSQMEEETFAKNPRSFANSLMSACACVRVRFATFDVPYADFDRTQLNCGYHKSTMPRVLYTLRAFQRLSSTYARNSELYVSPQREL